MVSVKNKKHKTRDFPYINLPYRSFKKKAKRKWLKSFANLLRRNERYYRTEIMLYSNRFSIHFRRVFANYFCLNFQRSFNAAGSEIELRSRLRSASTNSPDQITCFHMQSRMFRVAKRLPWFRVFFLSQTHCTFNTKKVHVDIYRTTV